MNGLALAVAIIGCTNAYNMTICDNGVSVYNHGSQTEIYTQQGTIAEVYRPYNQVEIQPSYNPVIVPVQTNTLELSPLALDPLR